MEDNNSFSGIGNSKLAASGRRSWNFQDDGINLYLGKNSRGSIKRVYLHSGRVSLCPEWQPHSKRESLSGISQEFFLQGMFLLNRNTDEERTADQPIPSTAGGQT